MLQDSKFTKKILFLGILLISFVFVLSARAVPPTSPYLPGETLAPNCSPGETNCTVLPALTGTSTVGNIGFYTDTTTISGDNNLFWDNTNKRLGVGTANPAFTLDVTGTIRSTGNLTAPNVIYSLTAGNGISISSSQNPTISNSGVLSLNNATGTLTIQGTTNQVNVSTSNGTITLSTPQDIHTGASPIFAGLTLSTTPLAIGSGGTGATTAADARTNLGLAIGTNVQAWSAKLDQISSIATTTGNLLVASSNGWQGLTVGSNGKVLMASSTAPNGVSWETLSASGGLSGAGVAGQVTYFTSASAVSSTASLTFDDANGILYAKQLRQTKNTWTSMANAPGGVRDGGSLVYTGGDYIYAFQGNCFSSFWRYSISSNTWTSMAYAPESVVGGSVGSGGSLVYTGGDYIYAFQGYGNLSFWRYSISSNSWTSMANAPGGVYYGGSLVYTGGDYIYAFQGGYTSSFWRYSISSNSWSSMANAPGGVCEGGSLVYTGGDYIYAFQGYGNLSFWRYSISSNSWTSMADAPGNVDYGGSLVYTGGDYIYAFQGNGTSSFWRYSGASDQGWNRLVNAGAMINGNATINGNANINGNLLNSGNITFRNNQLSAPTGVTATAQSSGGTLNGYTYYDYKVVALDAEGGTTLGSTQAVCFIEEWDNDNSCLISWNAVPGASSYRVYGRDAYWGNPDNGTFDQYWTTTNTSYTDTGSPGTSGSLPTENTAFLNKFIFNSSASYWKSANPIGIGTSTPSASTTLDVAGHVRITGGLCLRDSTDCPAFSNGRLYVDTAGTNASDDAGDVFDVAETYKASESVSPGDVVSIDVNNPKKVKLSDSPYDDKLIGVVSTEPGMAIKGSAVILGPGKQASSTEEPLVALVGRVPVKVSLENGPISVGDYLTSASSTRGAAMKATGPGRVIGIALESFDGSNSTSSMVLTFVNPHWFGGVLDDSGMLANGSASSTDITNSQSTNILDYFTQKVKLALEKIGVFISNGIAKIKELVAEKITTKKLCIGDTCVTEEQLKALLNQNNIQSAPASPSSDSNANTSDITSATSTTSTTSATSATSTIENSTSNENSTSTENSTVSSTENQETAPAQSSSGSLETSETQPTSSSNNESTNPESPSSETISGETSGTAPVESAPAVENSVTTP